MENTHKEHFLGSTTACLGFGRLGFFFCFWFCFFGIFCLFFFSFLFFFVCFLLFLFGFPSAKTFTNPKKKVSVFDLTEINQGFESQPRQFPSFYPSNQKQTFSLRFFFFEESVGVGVEEEEEEEEER